MLPEGLPQPDNIKYIRSAKEYFDIALTPSLEDFIDKNGKDKMNNRYRKNMEKGYAYANLLMDKDIPLEEWVSKGVRVYNDSELGLCKSVPKRKLNGDIDSNELKSKMAKLDDNINEGVNESMPIKSDSNFALRCMDKLKILHSNLLPFPSDLYTDIEKNDENIFIITVSGTRSCGKTTFIDSIALKYEYQLVKVDASFLSHFSSNKLFNFIEILVQKYKKILIHLPFSSVSNKIASEIEIMVRDEFFQSKILIACEIYNTQIMKSYHNLIIMPSYLKDDRLRCFKHFYTRWENLNTDILDDLISWSVGFEIGMMKSFSKYLMGVDGPITNDVLKKAVLKIRQLFPNSRYMFTSTTSNWNDVGGHEEIKKKLIESITNLVDESITTKVDGILLYGPPGTGKTLMARAISSKMDICFFDVSVTEILTKYQGESEKNVENWFNMAQRAQPCIMFIDEIDSLCSKRGDSNQGSRNAVVNQFLRNLDGLNNNKNNKVLVIGATNCIDRIDEAIRRRGRLGQVIKVDIPKNAEERYNTLTAAFRRSKFCNEEERESILRHISSDECSEGFSQAELASLVSTFEKTPVTLSAISELIKSERMYKKSDFVDNTIEIPFSKLAEELNDKFLPSDIYMEEMCSILDKCENVDFINICGKRQSGKTTLMNFLAHKFERNIIHYKDSYYDDFQLERFWLELKSYIQDNGNTFVVLSDLPIEIYELIKGSICKKKLWKNKVLIVMETEEEEGALLKVLPLNEDERNRYISKIIDSRNMILTDDQLMEVKKGIEDWPIQKFRKLDMFLVNQPERVITEIKCINKFG